MGKLATLKENRSKAKDELRACTDELAAILNGNAKEGIEGRAWTPEEEQRLEGLQNRVTQLDRLIADAEEERKAAKKQQEKRDAKLGATQREVEKRSPAGGAGNAYVKNGTENLTYSAGNPENSFIRDMVSAAFPNLRGWDEARERLKRHQEEIDEIRKRAPHDSPEGRAVRRYYRDVNPIGQTREWSQENVRARDIDSREVRDISTGTSSMGDFAPPLYFLPDYAAYRTYGRTLIDALKKRPLPETGMVFNIPLITTPTEAENQTGGSSTQGNGENQTISTRDMTSVYQAGTVQTVVDNLLVSQQYLDRVGPGIDGDLIVRDDQTRQMNYLLNLYGWQALFGTAGIGTNNFPVTPSASSSFNAEAAAFRRFLGQAKAAMETTDGTVTYPTHFFCDPTLWEQIEGSYDSQNRPFVVPQGVAFNPMAVGDNAGVPEGYTGFHYASVPAFKDEAMWLAWNGGAGSAGFTTDHPALVGDLSLAAEWLEGTPVIRVLPQPYAATLTVLIQQYKYCAYIPKYPAAMQLVFGAGTADSLVSAFD